MEKFKDERTETVFDETKIAQRFVSLRGGDEKSINK